jgi:lipopolysaccharide transport system ATP-binding protein
VAAHLAADTIIVDEVLAVGDAEFQEKCARTMRASTERGRTSLFVSHNMALVENLCTRAILLERGTVTGIGPAEAIVRQYLHKAMSDSSACVDYLRDGGTPTQACSIRTARMRGADGGPPVQGEDALLRIEFEVHHPVRQLELWLGLSTVEGERVAALNSSDYRHDWTLEPGAYVVDIRIPQVRLLPRRYAFTLRLQHRAGDVYDNAIDAVVFSVLERDVLGTGVPLLADRGVTWLPAVFRLQAQ